MGVGWKDQSSHAGRYDTANGWQPKPHRVHRELADPDSYRAGTVKASGPGASEAGTSGCMCIHVANGPAKGRVV